MSNYVNTTIETREAEVNYIVEIHKDMRDNCKHWYTNSYDFSNGDRVKITVETTKNRAGAVTTAEREERKMFKLRVQYLDGQVNDVVADNNTLVLLETMMRYGIIARLTCKLR